MNAAAVILAIARKEVQENLRNRWVLAATLLMAGLALSLTLLGSAPTGTVGVRPLDVVVVSLSSLSIFLVPLIALLLSHDAVVGEVERGTMLLLLSYPVSRWQVLLGKFLGHLAILVFATLVGYGAAALALRLTGHALDADSLRAFSGLIGASILLGAAFLAIGYLVSTLVRQRGTAAGIAIGIWLVFVLVYDMALMGLLVVDQGERLTGGLLDALLLVNPTDAYRLLTLSGSERVGALSGMGSLAGTTRLTAPVLVGALAAWVGLPLLIASFLFSRRDI